MNKVILSIFLFISSFAIANDSTTLVDKKIFISNSDTIGDRERTLMDTPEPQPSRDDHLYKKSSCVSRHTMLDRVGCLQSDGITTAKHCAVKTISRGRGETNFDLCGSGFRNVYYCSEYVVCIKNETGDTNINVKKIDEPKGVR
jgi:hypothetical protein